MADLLPFPPLPLEFPPNVPAQPPDAEARQQALDIRRSFIVEAPAGSGKTGLLIQRFLKLLADPAVTSPEQVLAITFTIKATAEMRDRILRHLEAVRRGSTVPVSDFDRETRALAVAVLERDERLEWSLLDNPGRLNIRTIDSVCGQIARTLPILSGSGGRLTPANDAAPLHREAARRTLLLLGGGDAAFDDALRNLLLHRDGNLADCELLIADMLSLRDQWGELVPLSRPELDDAYLDAHVLPRLEKALDHAICSELSQLEQAFPSDVLAELADLTGELGHADGYKERPSPIAHCAGIHHSPSAITAHLDHWLALIGMLTTADGGWRKERGINGKTLKFTYDRKTLHHARLVSVIDELSDRDDLLLAFKKVRKLPPASYPEAQWRVAKSLFRVLSRALVELQFVFAERDECDFTEPSLLARHALSQEAGAADLADALGARLQHLLVDEMQDTSAGQYDLIQLLTASWDGYSQTVFLVGDPRQSIYLFRQARVERFLQTMRTQRIGELPLQRLQLTANFRSQQDLVDQFNEDFSVIFPPSHAAEALPYTKADAVLPPSPYAIGVNWHVDVLPYAGSPGVQSPETAGLSAQQQKIKRRQHADEILHIAERWFSTPLPEGRKKIRDASGSEFREPWRIAVLVRSRNHLAEIVAALRQREPSIPFRAIEIEALNERQEVLDLTALTRALLHPADRVAALAVLRAPWCGLSLADLHTLTGADDPGARKRSIQRLIAQREHLLPDESRRRVSRVQAVLQAATTQRAHLTTAQLVERAWRSLGGDAWLTEAELVNTRRFFRLLDDIDSEHGDTGGIDPAVLDARLRKLYAEPDPVSPGTAFIDLLTIHKAKGLEWDVVMIPAMERDPGRNPSRLLTWSVLDGSDSATQPSANEASDTAAHIMLAPIAAKGENVDTLTTWLNQLQRAREAAENKRLFYVACTRAREELHLFAAPRMKADGDIGVRPHSILQAARPAAEPHFLGGTDASSELELAAVGTPTTVFKEGDSSLREASSSIVQRMPLTFDPTARFVASREEKVPYGEPEAVLRSSEAQFSRPEGSFAARSFGNVVHASLEMIAQRLADGQSPNQLLTELATWTPRLAALLRADGLARATVDGLAREARTALEKVLRDPDGLWLLAPHPGAASEFALIASPTPEGSASQGIQRPVSVRADRIFHAGSEPHAPGENSLWIIDYKTTAYGAAGIDAFLAAQRTAYAPQLEAYARILAPAQSKPVTEVRLALYFPTLPRLIWWKAPPAKE